jgi:hypothetical protein
VCDHLTMPKLLLHGLISTTISWHCNLIRLKYLLLSTKLEMKSIIWNLIKQHFSNISNLQNFIPTLHKIQWFIGSATLRSPSWAVGIQRSVYATLSTINTFIVRANDTYFDQKLYVVKVRTKKKWNIYQVIDLSFDLWSPHRLTLKAGISEVHSE